MGVAPKGLPFVLLNISINGLDSTMMTEVAKFVDDNKLFRVQKAKLIGGKNEAESHNIDCMCNNLLDEIQC